MSGGRRRPSRSVVDTHDTALALEATVSREFFLNRLRMDVDALSHQYDALRRCNDTWNQVIMVVSAFGALITSILTIANLIGWPYEIVPIVIQTLSGVLAAWIRFYDFPKRMEAIINTKHASNDIRERLHKAPAIDENLWELYCSAVKDLDSVLTPDERDRSHVLALKYMKRERIREAQLHKLLSLSNDELINGRSLRKLGINGNKSFKDESSDGSPIPSPLPRKSFRTSDLRVSIPKSVKENVSQAPMNSEMGLRSSSASFHADGDNTKTSLVPDVKRTLDDLDSDSDSVELSKET